MAKDWHYWEDGKQSGIVLGIPEQRSSRYMYNLPGQNLVITIPCKEHLEREEVEDSGYGQGFLGKRFQR